MSQKSHKQVLYTDGSCIPNPGPGGWAFVALPNPLDESPIEWHVSGGDPKSTNNRMELQAVIEALMFCHDKKEYIIYSDSQYVIKCAKGIYARKKNTDIWTNYDKVSKGKVIEWEWVKGHSGDKYNEIVDHLAKQEAKITK
jgi:ribonuclease HI